MLETNETKSQEHGRKRLCRRKEFGIVSLTHYTTGRIQIPGSEICWWAFWMTF